MGGVGVAASNFQGVLACLGLLWRIVVTWDRLLRLPLPLPLPQPLPLSLPLLLAGWRSLSIKLSTRFDSSLHVELQDV